MEKPPVHPGIIEDPHRAGITIRKDRLAAELYRRLLKPCRDRIERLIPRDPLKPSFTLFAHTLLWIEHPVGRIFALQILRDLAAQKSSRHRMIGIAAQPAALAVIDVDQERTGIGTIARADGVSNLHRGRIAIVHYHGSECGGSAASFSAFY